MSDIEEEISQHLQVTVIDSGTQVLPYQSLSPEQFECLLWDLFRSGYECDLGHDYTRLMLAGADQGRDVWLTCQGRPVGLVQCKRYAGKFSRIEVLKEIIKFLLHADLNCSGQLKLATVLYSSQYLRSDSLGVSPLLY
ncbi:restriction endonuclease [Shewanella algae]|uniref:restriction endonuclease n=1 Tax=Shewanella algae TaxID=38313 RepID=UPI0035306F45